MTAPVVNSITFDKPSYEAGETITATVSAQSENKTVTDFVVTGTVTDSQTSEIGTGTATLALEYPNACTASITDADNHVWTAGAFAMDSAGAITAQFTTTA